MTDNNDIHNLEIIQPSAIEAISRAEVDISISTARRFPRDISKVKQKMITFATMDQATSEACFYSLPRGGKNIQGPSVRLAEIAISCYGNLRVGSRIIATVATGENPHVVVQAVATDLENNISISIEKRRRITKKKSKEFIDEDDINLAANACSSIALRDAVFRVVPLALVKPVFEAARKVAIGDQRTLGERRQKSLDTFAKMGITKDRVLAKLEKKSVEEIDLGDIEIMIGLYNAIKEEEVRLDDAFPPINQTKSPEIPGQMKPAPKTTSEPSKAAEAPKTAPEASKVENAAPVAPVETKTATPEPVDEVKELADAGLSPVTGNPVTETPTTHAETSEPQPPTEPDPKLAPKAGDSDGLASVKLLAAKSGVTYEGLMKWAVQSKLAKENQALSDLSEAKLTSIGQRWNAILPKLR